MKFAYCETQMLSACKYIVAAVAHHLNSTIDFENQYPPDGVSPPPVQCRLPASCADMWGIPGEVIDGVQTFVFQSGATALAPGVASGLAAVLALRVWLS